MNHLKKLVQSAFPAANLPRLMLLMIFAVGVMQPPVFALSVSVNRKNFVITRDGNGLQPEVGGDKPWKIYELSVNETASVLRDETGTPQTQGVVHQICAETGTVGTAQNEWVSLWDRVSTTTPALNASTTGMIYAPISRATLTIVCSPILDAIFTAGAIVGQSALGKRAWVYWAPSGRQ